MKIRMVVLVCLLTLAGCTNADGTPLGPGGNGGDPEPPAAPALPPDYWLIVDALDVKSRDVLRPLTCTFVGLDATGDVVEITAQGKTNRYLTVVNTWTLGDMNKSRRFPIYTQGAPALAVIKYECSITGAVGDSILCEAVSADGQRPAPLLNSLDYSEIEFGHGDVARCYGVINALA